MFSIKANPTFEGTVKVPTPTGEQDVVFIFKHKKRAELRDYFERTAKAEDGNEAKGLLEIIEGWKDVDTPFSEAALGELIENFYGSLPAIFDAYIAGLTQAKAKN